MAELEAEFPCALPMIVSGGVRRWSLFRDKRGYRTYTITHRVQVDRDSQGPLSALEGAVGLPEPGSQWSEPDLFDEWAYFTQEAKVEPVGREGELEFFDITQTATSDPSDECAEDLKEDPLAIADRVRVESVDYQKEAVFDKFDDAIVNSAWEQYRGPQVEFDASRVRVVIEQNAGALELDLIMSLMHHTNDAVMWGGMDINTIKLSGFSAEPKYHTNCDKYWLRRFIFDIDPNGWNRKLLDEGTKVLHGRWDQKEGTGATVTITVDGGGILTAAFLAGGSGYPASCIVPLKVNNGVGGIVLAETNAAGEVVSINRIHMEGSGYTAGDKSTTQRGHWVLLRINATGDVPVHTNPQHFDRPGDMKGQNTRFILDTKGMPIAEDEDAGEIEVEYYEQSNLLLLGIPLALD